MSYRGAAQAASANVNSPDSSSVSVNNDKLPITLVRSTPASHSGYL